MFSRKGILSTSFTFFNPFPFFPSAFWNLFYSAAFNSCFELCFLTFNWFLLTLSLCCFQCLCAAPGIFLCAWKTKLLCLKCVKLQKYLRNREALPRQRINHIKKEVTHCANCIPFILGPPLCSTAQSWGDQPRYAMQDFPAKMLLWIQHFFIWFNQKYQKTPLHYRIYIISWSWNEKTFK